MQRITDIWRNLVRYHPPPRQEQEAEAEEEEESEDRDGQINEVFRNQYWTRMVSLQGEPGQIIARWPLADDVIGCLDEVEGIEGRENGESNFIFDPEDFLRQVPTPTVTEHELDVDRLRELAI